jgi:hypothetical protein
MGLFENNYDTDTLRAIAYARMQIAAGLGLESILTSMSRADLGRVSAALRAPLARMRAGEDTRAVLQEIIEAAPSRNLAELFSALLLEGEAALVRMDELSQDVQGERKVKVEAFGKSIQSRLNVVAILFLATYIPIILHVLEQIPPNDVIPEIHFPNWFYAGYTVFLALALTALTFTLRYDE